MQIGQNGCCKNIDPSQQVIRRDHLGEAKLVKQLPLISVLPPHHRRLSCRFLSRNHCSFRSSTPFSTASTHFGNQHSRPEMAPDAARLLPEPAASSVMDQVSPPAKMSFLMTA
jgi:hypothetical protein